MFDCYILVLVPVTVILVPVTVILVPVTVPAVLIVIVQFLQSGYSPLFIVADGDNPLIILTHGHSVFPP